MKKIYLPIIALVSGFIWAFITAGVYSILFVFLPLLAFAFGYFSTWRRGLLCGLLLFLGYTFATTFMWYGVSINLLYFLQYFYAFIMGGFSLLLIGALAPLVRRGVRNIGSIVVLIIVGFFMVWCGFQAWPSYNYYYQVFIHTDKELNDLELYLPSGFVEAGIYEKLYDSSFNDPMAPLTREYSKQLVDTKHGRMLKITLPRFMKEGPPGYLPGLRQPDSC